MCIPNALYACGTDRLCRGHRPHTPMRCRFRLRLQGCFDDLLNLIGGDSRFTPATRSVVHQRRWSVPRKSFSPQDDSWTELQPMSTPRGGLALIGVNSTEGGCGGYLYALGGGWRDYTNTGERYDPTADEWVPLTSPPTDQLIVERTDCSTGLGLRLRQRFRPHF